MSTTDNEVLSKPLLFGKYCLLERISVGGMAEVFKAKQFGVEGFERLLAVKRILDTIAEDEVFINMFIDEAKIAGQLNHPNIAQIFDLGKVDGSYFIALEFVSGKDLRTIWERMVSHAETPDIFFGCHSVMKACEALQYAHTKRDAAGNELNIVHRDVSPQNILVSHEGDVKIIDFGIAKAQGKSSQTQVGILKGKFSYMSPEQVRGLHVDHRADVFSLAIVLYEMLTLRRLFLGESDFDTLEKIRKVEMSPPTLFNPHIPIELEDIVLKALAKNPDDRYQSASEFQEALQGFMRNQSSYYGTKDLAIYMKSTFAADIELERKKLDYYRTINIESLGGEPIEDSVTPGPPQSGDWVEQSETQIYGRGQAPPSFNEISPAAEISLGDPGFSEPAFVSPGSIAPPPPEQPKGAGGEIRATSGPPEIVFSEAALSKLPGVNLDEPLDGDEDPTMEWDRFNVDELGNAPKKSTKGGKPPTRDKIKAPEPIPPIFDVGSSGPRGGTGTAETPSLLEPRNSHRSSTGLIIALLSFIFVLVMAGIAAVMLLPKVLDADKANINFKVAEAKEVKITIDGKVVYAGPNKGDITITEQEPGKRKIEVSADGFTTSSDEIKLESGKDYEIPIALKAATSEGDTGFALTFEPKDAKVSLDGKPIDATSPFKKADLKAGKYVLTFKKEGFLDETREIKVEGGELEKVEVTLRPAQVSLQVVSQPEGAEAIVYERDKTDPDKRQKVKNGTTPLTLPGLDARKVYDVEIYMDGHEPFKQVFEPGVKANASIVGKMAPVVAVNDAVPDKAEDDKGDRKKPDADELDRRRKEREERRRAEEERRARILAEADKKPDKGVAKAPDKRADPVKKADPPPSGPGYVAIISKPPARVILDGRDIGFTPKLKIELPAGRHRAVLKMESIGVTRSYSFTIKPGTTHMIKGRPPK